MRPMLASTPTQDVLKKHLSETYLFASYKLDGIRAVTTKEGDWWKVLDYEWSSDSQQEAVVQEEIDIDDYFEIAF